MIIEEAPIEEMIYNVDFSCPCCSKTFTTTFARAKYQQMEGTDSDFCNYYKSINPYYYEAIVCMHCGYSFTRELADKLDYPTAQKILKSMKNWKTKDYSGPRSLEQAIVAMTLTVYCQNQRAIKYLTKGKLYQKLAWLYRYNKDSENETRFLNVALDNFLRSYELGEIYQPKREMEILYLIGECYNRTGHPHEAVNWFARLAQHENNKTYPAIVNMAREQWQKIRQVMKQNIPAV